MLLHGTHRTPVCFRANTTRHRMRCRSPRCCRSPRRYRSPRRCRCSRLWFTASWYGAMRRLKAKMWWQRNMTKFFVRWSLNLQTTQVSRQLKTLVRNTAFHLDVKKCVSGKKYVEENLLFVFPDLLITSLLRQTLNASDVP